MADMVLFNQLEILLNTLQDLFCPTQTKFAYKPHLGIFIVLAEIARWTSRENISRLISAIFGLRNKVILVKNRGIVPESRRLSAIGANTVKKIYSLFPMALFKCGWEFTRFGAAAMSKEPISITVVFSPAAHILRRITRLGRSRFLLTMPDLSMVFLIITPIVFAFFIWMCLFPVSPGGPSSFWVLLSPFSSPFSECFRICLSAIAAFLSVTFRIGPIGFMLALTYPRSIAYNTTSGQFGPNARLESEIVQRGSVPKATFGASFDGDWLIDHGICTPCNSVLGDVDRRTEFAFRSGNYADLVHNEIITQVEAQWENRFSQCAS